MDCGLIFPRMELPKGLALLRTGLTGLIFFFFVTLSVFARAAEVTGVRVGENAGKTRFVLDITGAVSYSVFTLPDPYRVVIDLPEMGWRADEQGAGKGRGLIERYRFGLFEPGTSRVVLDLSGPADVQKVFLLEPQGPYGYRLVLDLNAAGRQSFLASARKPIARSDTTPEIAIQPSPGDRARTGPYVIVLDPGHGGVDPGTTSVIGVQEKKVVLDMALEIKKAIEKNPRYRVVLTRDRDIFLPLRRRIEVTRRAKADLFLSIHSDAIRNSRVRGATVYTLSENASDTEAAALAAKENKADLIAGIDLSQETAEVTSILIDLTQRESMNYSARFANYLVPLLANDWVVRTNSHRFAGFVVLKAPDVPSVLLELGYLSNKQDAQLLVSQDGKRRLSEALTLAIDRYFDALESER